MLDYTGAAIGLLPAFGYSTMRILIAFVAALCPWIAVEAAETFYVGGRIGSAQYDGTADASRNPSTIGGLPTEISIDGLPFDSEETAWGIFGGWYVTEWLGLEIGFNDLGNTGRESLVGVLGGGGIISSGVAVDVEEVYLAPRFSVSLPHRWSANWIVGVTQTSFDTTGSFPFFTVLPFTTPTQTIPYASPDDETGYLWGFGFGFDVSDQWKLDVGFRRHETQVFSVDTFDLGVQVDF